MDIFAFVIVGAPALLFLMSVSQWELQAMFFYGGLTVAAWYVMSRK